MKEDNACSQYVSISALKWFFISELLKYLAFARNNFKAALISPGSSFLCN